MAGVTSSDTNIKDPWGGISRLLAGGVQKNTLGPMERYLGMGPSYGTPAYDKQQTRLDNASGPLGDWLRQFRAFEPGVMGQAQDIGNETAARGSDAFQALHGQVNSFLSQLPHFQALAGDTTAMAQRYANRAASPIGDEDLFQTGARRLLDTVNTGAAARGMESGGAAQQAGTDAVRGLVGDIRANRVNEQQQSLGAFQNAIQGQTGLAQAGIPVAQAGMEGVGQLSQLLQQRFGIPMAAAGQLLGMLTGNVGPATQLAQATAPIGAPTSKGVHTILS
jgi:hypothetical protein